MLTPPAPYDLPEPSLSATPKGKGKSKALVTPTQSVKGRKVPVIDPLQDSTDMGDAENKRWTETERAAFKGRKAWDEDSQLHVTEVAVSSFHRSRHLLTRFETTLIVAPPSLLKQWVSEMRSHAPSLRVCVYEGWKSLHKDNENQRTAYAKARDAVRKRKNEQSRRDVVNKYARLNGGRRMKVDVVGHDVCTEGTGTIEEDASDEGDIQEESTLERTQRLFVDHVRAHDVVVTTYQWVQSVHLQIKLLTIGSDREYAETLTALIS